MAATILDVAKLCGYSKATVSRAFASPEQVSEKTRNKIYQAAQQLNYTPDAIARAMVRGRTDNIGFIIYEKQYPVVMNPFYSPIFESVMQTCGRKGYSLFISSHGDLKLPNGQTCVKKQLDGIILAGHSDEQLVSDLRRQVRGQGGSIRMEASADNFLTRGTIELVNGKFEIAREMFEKALAEAPSVDAYVGLAMCSEQIRGKEALHQYAGDITKNKFFARAMELAEGDKYTELQEIARTCIANIDWEKKCVVEQRKCATAVERVMDSLQTFSLPLDSHRNCAQTEETIAQVRKLQEKCKKESPLVSGLRMFLYLGNLIPAVFMLASSIARHFGWDSTIDWISMPGVLLGLVIYVLSGFTLLSLIPALDGGGFSVLIRLAAGFITFMVTIPNLNGMEDRFTYLLCSAIASALFYLIFDLRKKPMFARLKAARENAVVLMQQLPQQIQLLEQETWNEIEKAMVPYQQYYRPDDWKEQRKHWKMVLNNACNARMNLQAQALQDITK